MGIVSEIEPTKAVQAVYHRPAQQKRSLSACEFRLRKSLQQQLKLDNKSCSKEKNTAIISYETKKEISISDDQVRLECLKGVRTIGEGAFSEVKLVKDTRTNKAYALKIQSRKFLRANDLEDLAENEIEIMKELVHPFIVQLHKTFLDSNNLYMLLEYVPGGELFSLIGRKGKYFDTNAHRFYAASVLSALEAMHKVDIVFRDLKPENILIDVQGYIKLVDFGFAKRLDGRTYTPCGTPEYFSPELIMGTGYGKGNDVWSFGILLYEIIFGRNPFSRHGEKKAEICRKIVYSPLKFRKSCGTKDTRDLLCGLLEKKEAKRLGCGVKGISELKSHPWFAGFKWDELLSRKILPPWVPSLIGNCDSTYFAEYYESNAGIPRNLCT